MIERSHQVLTAMLQPCSDRGAHIYSSWPAQLFTPEVAAIFEISNKTVLGEEQNQYLLRIVVLSLRCVIAMPRERDTDRSMHSCFSYVPASCRIFSEEFSRQLCEKKFTVPQ